MVRLYWFIVDFKGTLVSFLSHTDNLANVVVSLANSITFINALRFSLGFTPQTTESFITYGKRRQREIVGDLPLALWYWEMSTRTK